MKLSSALYVAAALLALAALPLPYAYYTGVRFLACLAFAFVAYQSMRAKAWPTMSLALALAITFNPLVPIRLSKLEWATIDLAAAAYLSVVASHVSAGFQGFRPPEVSLGQVAFMLAIAAFSAVFCMVLFAFLLFLATLPADLFGYKEPTRTLRYLYPAVGVAAAVAFLSGWAYYSGGRHEA
jgi:hypothetical protein